MQGLSCLVLGGTGAAGSRLLQEVLASPRFTRVGEYGRRVTPPEQMTRGHEKLEQRVIDFEQLDKADLREGHWDVIFIALGKSSRTAGSWVDFEKVDREYVVNAAQAAKSHDPTHAQRLVYISSIWANPHCRFPYFRSKGLTERKLANMGYHEVIIFRPGGFGEVHRDPPRPLEYTMGIIFGTLYRVTGNPHVYIPVRLLGKSMRIAGETGSRGLLPYSRAATEEEQDASVTVFTNQDSLVIAETFPDL